MKGEGDRNAQAPAWTVKGNDAEHRLLAGP